MTRTLLRVSGALLRDTSPDALNTLAILQFLFTESQTVYVFAEDLDVPEWPHRNIMENMWSSGTAKIQGVYIPWQDISRLGVTPPSEQIEFVQLRFDLKAVQPGGVEQLTALEFLDIVRVVAEFADFIDSRSRQALLMQSGLRDAAVGVDLQGAAQSVAFTLVVHLFSQPPLQGRGTPLGMLIETLVKLPNVPPDEAKKLTMLKDRRKL